MACGFRENKTANHELGLTIGFGARAERLERGLFKGLRQ
jgi:hypothetical protein